MAQRYLIAIGAGLAAGVLFVLPAKGMMLGMWLSVLAPLPLMIAVLGYGLSAGLMAALIGALACALIQPSLSIVFLVSNAVPALLLGWLSVHVFSGDRRIGPGLLLTVVTALAILAVWGMLAFVGFSYGGLDKAATEIAAGAHEIIKALPGIEDGAGGLNADDLAQVLVASVPAVMAFWSVLTLSINLWLAARVAMVSGQLSRPWPDLPSHLMLPRGALAAFAMASLACALPGVIRVMASAAAVALGVAFAMQGLAALHRLTRGLAARPGLLAGLYTLIFILFPLPLIIVAGVGVADNVKPLRRSLPTPSSNNV
jgi:hypothetical protein